MSESEQQRASDSILIGRIDERTKKIDRCLSKHIDHHWVVTMAIVVAFLAFVARWYWGK